MFLEKYVDLYFFLIRLCTCVISVLVHRGPRAAKLRKWVFPKWAGLAMALDVVIATKPPWLEAHKIEVSPRQLLASLLFSASLHWPLLWWVHFMESKRRGLSLLLSMAMLFYRSTLVLFHSHYVTWTHAALALFYVWCTLSPRASPELPIVATVAIV